MRTSRTSDSILVSDIPAMFSKGQSRGSPRTSIYRLRTAMEYAGPTDSYAHL